MKVAILSESSADEAAVRILVDGLLGRQSLPIHPPPLRSRGWPSVRQILPAVLKHLYYQTDAEALVVVVDSNHSPVHQEAHDQPEGGDERCRLCQLRKAVDRVQGEVRLLPNRPRIKTAVGIAVPAIEAWFLCGSDPRVSEAAWVDGLQSESCPYT